MTEVTSGVQGMNTLPLGTNSNPKYPWIVYSNTRHV